MAAVARYFAELQEAQKLTTKAIGEHVGVSDRIVSAWLKGEHSPKLDYVPALLDKLRGAWEDVERLMKAEATADDAKELAQQRLRSPQVSKRHLEVLAAMDDEELDALLEFAERFRRRQ